MRLIRCLRPLFIQRRRFVIRKQRCILGDQIPLPQNRIPVRLPALRRTLFREVERVGKRLLPAGKGELIFELEQLIFNKVEVCAIRRAPVKLDCVDQPVIVRLPENSSASVSKFTPNASENVC